MFLVLLGDFIGAFAVDSILSYFLGTAKLRQF